MKRALIMLTFAVATVFISASGASAEGLFPRLRAAVKGHHDTYGPHHAGHTYPRPAYYPVRNSADDWFPRYYGNFHARYLQNYGYPSGDIGLRGTAW